MTRNFRDHVAMDDLRLNYDKELHFVHDRLVITKKTVGRDIQDWDTKVYLAKQYLNRLKEDAANTAAYKLRHGEKPGKGPFGYITRKRTDNEKGDIFPDPATAPIVIAMYEWYATGAFSEEQVRAKVKEEFHFELSKGMIDAILKNPFYYGEQLYDGQLYGHVYEPLITRDLFEKVQAMKKRHDKVPVKYAGLLFMYRGLIKCASCGCTVTPERKRKPNGALYHYYHCTEYFGRHGAAWLTEEQLTEQFADLLDSMRIPDEQLQAITETLKSSHQSKVAFSSELRTRLDAEWTKYEQRISKLYEDKLDGEITNDFYTQKKQEYREKQKEIELRRSRMLVADEEYYLSACYLLELVNKAAELFRVAEPEEKRLILKTVLQDCVLNEKNTGLGA